MHVETPKNDVLFPLTQGSKKHAHIAAAPIRIQSSIYRDLEFPIHNGWSGTRGEKLPKHSKVKLRLSGNTAGPVIAVLGGISADRTAAPSDTDKGWWASLVGPGRAIDTKTVQVASIDYVAGDDVQPLILTPSDQASLFALALRRANISQLHGFVGGSFGGMVGLSFARQFPKMLQRLVMIAASHQPSPLAKGMRAIQQQILSDAIEQGRAQEGVVLARALAMMTYRTADELNTRFKITDHTNNDIESYIFARGRAFAKQMSAARFLTLSRSIDCQAEKPAQITTPTLLIGFENDLISPVSDMQDLFLQLAGPSQFVKYGSTFGHDAFLKDVPKFEEKISQFINEDLT